MSECSTSVDDDEVARFSAMAEEWWDPNGKFRPLHLFNPVRINYIKHHICQHFNREMQDAHALSGLKILDIGCGGGLLCEPMHRMGATITGLDPSEKNIAIANQHAKEMSLDIDYRACSLENLVNNEPQAQYDIILNMEVVEHVLDMPSFIATSASLLKKGGLMFVATLNRTMKAYALAIVGAEYVLRWLPKGTHRWEKFVKPEELYAALARGELDLKEAMGVSYNPLTKQWHQSRDMDVNYMLVAQK